MVRNILIVVLAVLLAATSYLLYENKNITIIIDSPSTQIEELRSRYGEYHEEEILGTLSADIDIKEDPESLDEDDLSPYLEPTVRLTINTDREIVTDYKVIGPREFALLTDGDEPMVEINLDTGEVKINPEYTLDQVSLEFWKSIGRKYPEVCFVE